MTNDQLKQKIESWEKVINDLGNEVKSVAQFISDERELIEKDKAVAREKVDLLNKREIALQTKMDKLNTLLSEND